MDRGIGFVALVIIVVIILIIAAGGVLVFTGRPAAAGTNSANTIVTSSTLNSSRTLQSAISLGDGTAVCISMGGLPDPSCTPGATNSNVTQSTIQSTICVSGWTSTVRPPENYTESLKYKSIKEYNYSDTYVGDYEEDHLIPLELGGSPTSVYNLWAEPHYGNYTSYDKDALENYLNAQVCGGNLTLVKAQQDIATNWVYYWGLYFKSNSSTG